MTERTTHTDPRVPLLDEALMTLDTYRARSPKMSSATATWRSSDAVRIIAALPAVGLVLATRAELEALLVDGIDLTASVLAILHDSGDSDR